jgi:hypothetical protein
MFQVKVVQKINKHILSPITFFLKLHRLWDNKEKYRRAGQATDDDMKHAHCILDNLGYTHTHTQSM